MTTAHRFPYLGLFYGELKVGVYRLELGRYLDRLFFNESYRLGAFIFFYSNDSLCIKL